MSYVFLKLSVLPNNCCINLFLFNLVCMNFCYSTFTTVKFNNSVFSSVLHIFSLKMFCCFMVIFLLNHSRNNGNLLSSIIKITTILMFCICNHAYILLIIFYVTCCITFQLFELYFINYMHKCCITIMHILAYSIILSHVVRLTFLFNLFLVC